MFGTGHFRLTSDFSVLKAKQYSGDVRHDELRTEVARLTLLTKALADLCVESGAFTKARLKERVAELDATKAGLQRGLDVNKVLHELLSNE